MKIEKFPTSTILVICEFLQSSDLCSLALCSRFLFKVCNFPFLWKKKFKSLELEKEFSFVTTFIKFQRKFQEFEEVFGVVKKWTSNLNLQQNLLKFKKSTIRIELLLKKYRSYNCSDPEIQKNLKSFLLLHYFIEGQEGNITGFFGGIEYYGEILNLFWKTPILVDDFRKDLAFGFDGPIHLELSKNGQVLYTNGDQHVSMGGFCEFFQERVDVLVAPIILQRIPFFNAPLLSFYPRKGNYFSEFTTTVESGVIKVSVSSVPVFDRSPVALYSYGIMIDALLVTHKMQLVYRRWQVNYPNSTEFIQGEGVIGKFPIFKKSGDRFFYSSCCSESYGIAPISMEGSFEFHGNGKTHLIKVPKFSFQTLGWND